MNTPNVVVDQNQRTQELLDRLLDEAIRPNASALAGILADRDVAIVFHNVSGGAQRAAVSLGWRGQAVGIARMTRTRAEKLAAALPPGDGAARWLRDRRARRIFVLSGQGTLCLNYSEQGYSIAPGTLDRSWMS